MSRCSCHPLRIGVQRGDGLGVLPRVPALCRRLGVGRALAHRAQGRRAPSSAKRPQLVELEGNDPAIGNRRGQPGLVWSPSGPCVDGGSALRIGST